MSSRHLVIGSFLVVASCAANVVPSSHIEPATSSGEAEAVVAEEEAPRPEVTEESAPSQRADTTPSQTTAVPVQVTWSNITSTATCFFFSGPAQLGRNDHLGNEATWRDDGGNLTLDFGEQVVFRGTMTGSNVTFLRRSSHDFGSKWDIEEQIDGVVAGALLTASYEYHECNTTNSRECPSECEITAQLTITIP